MKEWAPKGAIVRVSKPTVESDSGFEPEWIEPYGTKDTDYCDVIGEGDEWAIVPDDEVPDWVWATIAKRRLTE